MYIILQETNTIFNFNFNFNYFFKDELNATPASILSYIEVTFLKQFLEIVKRKMKDLKKAK